ncbi:MAG: hypothetical protein HYX90_10245 [Chloroflexi bacterium]|nr:hypothetical protein [Chloroflexota bacterium]
MEAKFRSPKSQYPVLLSVAIFAVASVALAMSSSPEPSSPPQASEVKADNAGVLPDVAVSDKLSLRWSVQPVEGDNHDAIVPPGVAVSDSAPASQPDNARDNLASIAVADQRGKNISFRSLKLVNNQWGAPANEKLASAVYLEQGRRFGWFWNRQDPMTKQGNVFVQPIYPSVRIGGNHIEQSKLASFPVKLSAVQSLISLVDYRYSEDPSGVFNLSYDLFLLDKATSGPNAKRKAEIMIWLHGTIGQPPQTYKGDFSDGHNTYELYSFVMSDGRLYSAFVMKNQPQFPSQHKVDIKRLMEKLDLDPNWYIPGIELGNEIVSGSGKIEISRLSLSLNGSDLEH